MVLGTAGVPLFWLLADGFVKPEEKKSTIEERRRCGEGGVAGGELLSDMMAHKEWVNERDELASTRFHSGQSLNLVEAREKIGGIVIGDVNNSTSLVNWVYRGRRLEAGSESVAGVDVTPMSAMVQLLEDILGI